MTHRLARCIAVCFLLAPCLHDANAQLAAGEMPEGIFVDLTQRPGWGPFIPRSGYSAHHLVGDFSLQGYAYRVFVLSHDDRSAEERVLFQRLNADVQAAEGDGMSVFYRSETVDLDGLAYDIMGISPVNGQFVLTKKEDVAYADIGLQKGEPLPSFEATLMDGGKLTNAALTESYVLIHFWGTWCGPCHAEVPYLVEAHQRFGDRIQFLGVAADDDEQAVRQYIAEHGFTWKQILVPNEFPNPAELVSLFEVRGFPTHYLIGPDGKVVMGIEQERRIRRERLLETLTRVVYGAHD